MILIALLPVVVSNLSGDNDRMTMYYNDHQQMEREILRKIPIGSNTQFAERIMRKNKFALRKQTLSTLEFDKEESYWPFYFGTFWAAEIVVSNGTVSDAKVWIRPAD